MATNYMLGNTSYYMVANESTFGVRAVTASRYVFGDTVNMVANTYTVERPFKSGTITEAECNYIVSGGDATVTMLMAIPDSLFMTEIMSSYMQAAVDLDEQINFGTIPKSFTIYQLDSVYTGSVRFATGCTVKSINIKSAPKTLPTMTILFVAKQIQTWTAKTSVPFSGSYPTGPTCNEIVGIGGVTVMSNLWDITDTITSINLTMDSELILDAVRYGNSAVPTNNTMVKKTITLDILSVFNPISVQALTLPNQAAVPTVGATTVYVGDGAFSNAFVLSNIITNYTLADPGRGTWKNSINSKCVKHNNGEALVYRITN